MFEMVKKLYYIELLQTENRTITSQMDSKVFKRYIRTYLKIAVQYNWQKFA